MTPYDRPVELTGPTIKYALECSTIYVTYNFDDDKLTEVFIRIGKAGSCSGCLVQSLGRVISIALQEGVELMKLSKTLMGMQCIGAQLGLRDDPKRLTSCMDAIAKELRRFERERKERLDALASVRKSDTPNCKCGALLLTAQLADGRCTKCRKALEEGNDNG